MEEYKYETFGDYQIFDQIKGRKSLYVKHNMLYKYNRKTETFKRVKNLKAIIIEPFSTFSIETGFLKEKCVGVIEHLGDGRWILLGLINETRVYQALMKDFERGFHSVHPMNRIHSGNCVIALRSIVNKGMSNDDNHHPFFEKKDRRKILCGTLTHEEVFRKTSKYFNR